MVDLPPPRPPWLVAEALGNGIILAELSAILAARFRTFQKDGADLSLEKQSGQGIHSFLAQLASGVDPIPSLERVKLVGVYPDGMVLLMHLLFSVRVDIYSTSRRLFACLDELLAEPPPR